MFYVFYSTKSEKKRMEYILPGSGVWGEEEGGPNNLYTCKFM
jgi:hypothetical protein